VPLGFERWLRTWVADYVSTEEVYWADHPVEMERLPARAFDSDEERSRTEQLLLECEPANVTPACDARFDQLAEERIRHAPLRYYGTLPAVRVADMWLRPRTEFLGFDTHWWDYESDLASFAISALLGLLNLVLVVEAGVG